MVKTETKWYMYYIQGYLVSAVAVTVYRNITELVLYGQNGNQVVYVLYTSGTWFPLQLIFHSKTEPVLYGQNGNQVVYVLYTKVLGFHCNIDITKTAILLKMLKKFFLKIFSKK